MRKDNLNRGSSFTFMKSKIKSKYPYFFTFGEINSFKATFICRVDSKNDVFYVSSNDPYSINKKNNNSKSIHKSIHKEIVFKVSKRFRKISIEEVVLM